MLDIRKNFIKEIPIELEECKSLKALLFGHNLFEGLPGNIYKLGRYVDI
jgi:hypothetical protein